MYVSATRAKQENNVRTSSPMLLSVSQTTKQPVCEYKKMIAKKKKKDVASNNNRIINTFNKKHDVFSTNNEHILLKAENENE